MLRHCSKITNFSDDVFFLNGSYKLSKNSPLLRIATLPWEIKASIFLHIFSTYGRKCKQIALLIASNFASLFPYWFTYLLLQSICGTGNSSQQTPLQCLSTMNMVFSNEDKILIKILCAITQYGERLTILNTENTKICGWITKL